MGKTILYSIFKKITSCATEHESGAVEHNILIGSNVDHLYFGESAWILDLFRRAEKIGVFHEPMYQWYQYPTSQSHTNLAANIKQYPKYWHTLKNYLEYYGPISKTNEDFLYAIYMSLIDEGATFTLQSDLPVYEKLDILRQIFHEPLWAETMAREANPQFHNLAARGEYVQQMKERILALAVTPEQQSLAAEAVRELDKPQAR